MKNQIAITLLFFCFQKFLQEVHPKIAAEPSECGIPIEPEEFPFLVSIFHQGSWVAEGAILNSDWILTTAQPLKEGKLEIRAGYSKPNSDGTWEQLAFSSRVVTHPDYYRDTYENDIALVKISPPLNFADTVQPAKLPDAFFVAIGDSKAVGRGRTNGNSNSTLHTQSIHMLPSINCAAVYGSIFHFTKMICGNVKGLNITPCVGLSGSPIFCSEPSFNKTLLCGISSFETPMGPTVYTRISYYRNWIISVMEEPSTSNEDSLKSLSNDDKVLDSSPKKCGMEAIPNEFPFIVSIYKDKTHVCEGSIISNTWVLTAASCVQKEGIGILAGGHNIVKKENGTQISIPLLIVRHPDFDRTTYENDIALIKVFPAFENITATPIANYNFQEPQETLVAGWGIHDGKDASFESKLHKQIARREDSFKCSAYRSHFRSWKNFCVGDGLGKGLCVGFPGSPIICPHKETKKGFLCGMVDFRRPGLPSVILKLSYYFDWIMKETSIQRVILINDVEATKGKEATPAPGVKGEASGIPTSFVEIMIISLLAFVKL